MICGAYCSHGGVCELVPGHAGLHDTGYCQWEDDASIDRESADDLVRLQFAKNRMPGEIAELVIGLSEIVMAPKPGEGVI